MNTRLTQLLIVLLGLLLGASAAHSEEVSPEAKQHFQAGVAYVDDPNGPKWEEALKEFRASYAAYPTWKIANNIGLCALNLERDGEAIDAYKEYLAHGGEKDFTPKQRKQMEKDIAMLTASLVRVNVTVQPADALLVDERRNSKGELLVNRYPVKGGKASLGIHPGHHRIALEAPGYVTASWTFEAEPASTHQHDFQLEAEKKPDLASPAPKVEPAPLGTASPAPSKLTQRKTPTAVYVGLAATGVFTVAATITGIVALNRDKDFDNATDPSAKEDIKKSGRNFVLMTDIAIGAAVLSAGATAYFYFTAPRVEQVGGPSATKTRGAQLASVHVSPFAGPNAAGLAFFGKF